MAADGADAHARAPGDFFDLGLQAHLGEHVLGRGEHPLPVAPGVAAHRPVRGAGVLACVRGHGGSRRNGMVLPIVANRNRHSASDGRRRCRHPSVAGLAEIDLTDLDNFADGFPHDLFAIHRREAPVWWHQPTDHTPDGEGFWSVATHARDARGAPRPRHVLVGARRSRAGTAARCSRISTSRGSSST